MERFFAHGISANQDQGNDSALNCGSWMEDFPWHKYSARGQVIRAIWAWYMKELPRPAGMTHSDYDWSLDMFFLWFSEKRSLPMHVFFLNFMLYKIIIKIRKFTCCIYISAWLIILQHHYIDITWASRPLKSLATQLFIQLFAQCENNENIKVLYCWNFVRETTIWIFNLNQNTIFIQEYEFEIFVGKIVAI